MSDKAYKKMSIKGREHVANNYNFENHTKQNGFALIDDVY